MSVCEHCKNNVHDEKPEDCRGYVWCDCQHRLPPPEPPTVTIETNDPVNTKGWKQWKLVKVQRK